MGWDFFLTNSDIPNNKANGGGRGGEDVPVPFSAADDGLDFRNSLSPPRVSGLFENSLKVIEK